MKHIIIGTAGHVDHGKTLLVKALTGIDTDRLQEEKKRGITIDLGFAHLDWKDGTSAGLVDVPGHEKFIKNMLAGAGGIDLAMLIVAADEGFMPQTVEHLDILTLLGIKSGVVVITKADKVDEEWLELMVEEIRDRVKGTFLENSEIIPVSAHTGYNIEKLSNIIHDLVEHVGAKNVRVPFRLPVDRVFSVEGFGTVVTGTLIEGSVSEGEWAEVFPSNLMARVRNIQVHGNQVKTAFAGQRVAINVAGIKKTDLKRGDIIAKPTSMRSSFLLDVKLHNLNTSERIIKNAMQVHLYHGSTVQLAKVILLDKDELRPGEEGYAQLRMSETISTKIGDHFVLRFYSPLETIGGGVILDDMPVLHKRNIPSVIDMLKIKETGSDNDRVYQCIKEFGLKLPTIEQIAEKLLKQEEKEGLSNELHELVNSGKVVEPTEGRYVADVAIDELIKKCREVLTQYHTKNPLHGGMFAPELKQKVLNKVEFADVLLGELLREGVIKKMQQYYCLSGFSVKLTKRQNTIYNKLLSYYKSAGIAPDATEEVIEGFERKDRDECKNILKSLLTSGELIMISPSICYDRETYSRVMALLVEHFSENDTITLAEFRDIINSSRKYALAFLEYLDKNKITVKVDDSRKLLVKLESIMD